MRFNARHSYRSVLEKMRLNSFMFNIIILAWISKTNDFLFHPSLAARSIAEKILAFKPFSRVMRDTADYACLPGKYEIEVEFLKNISKYEDVNDRACSLEMRTKNRFPRHRIYSDSNRDHTRRKKKTRRTHASGKVT